LPQVWFGLLRSTVMPKIIQEHFSLYSAGPVAWTVTLFGLIYLAALAGVRPRQMRVTWLLPLLWLVLTFTRIRHGPLFVIVAALALGEMYLDVRWREWLAKKGSFACRLQTRELSAATWAATAKGMVVPMLLVVAAFVLKATGVTALFLGRGW